MIFLFLLLSFLQVGLFSYGGSEGSLALLQHEIVEQQHWLTSDEFAQLLALSNVLPGDFAVQFAAYGKRILGCHRRKPHCYDGCGTSLSILERMLRTPARNFF